MSEKLWVAVDWGTSNLRIWIMTAAGEVIERVISDQGMLGLESAQFEPVLLAHLKPWLKQGALRVIACGMVGSRQGWTEAPYETVPAFPALKTVDVQAQDPRLNVKVIAGLAQQDPADVMRGEETQIAGYLAQHSGFSGVLCLPGTHSKWVEVEDGKVMSFQTALTGEMFDLLSQNSILQHSMGTWEQQQFLQAAQASLADPQSLLMSLFSVRAEQILQGIETGEARLSGMLIGAELGALKSIWQDKNVAIIGAGKLAQLYGAALSQEGVNVSVEEGDDMTLIGLKHVFESVFK